MAVVSMTGETEVEGERTLPRVSGTQKNVNASARRQKAAKKM